MFANAEVSVRTVCEDEGFEELPTGLEVLNEVGETLYALLVLSFHEERHAVCEDAELLELFQVHVEVVSAF